MTDRYILGVGFGSTNEPTALAIVRETEWRLELTDVKRFPLNATFQQITGNIAGVYNELRTGPDRYVSVFADTTTAGKQVEQVLQEEQAQAQLVHFVTGDTESKENGTTRLPLTNLVSSLKVALQDSMVAMPGTQAERTKSELLGFDARVKLSIVPSNDIVWRQGKNDDIVLAIGLCVWAATGRPQAFVNSTIVPRPALGLGDDTPGSGGRQVLRHGFDLTVPKVRLVLGTKRLLASGRLKFAWGTDLIAAELQTMEIKAGNRGRFTIEHRRGHHDDAVMAMAIALFVGESIRKD